MAEAKLPERALAAGERVYLRHPDEGDAGELLRLNQASVAHHHPWVAAPVTPEQVQGYLERSRREDTACFLICQRETGAIAGVVNLSQIFHGNFQSAYMGYYIGAPYARRGYMTDAIGALLGYAFGPLGLHRIEANIQPGNEASLAVVRRLGFTREGYSRRYLKIDGEWRDHERWAIVAEDWAAR